MAHKTLVGGTAYEVSGGKTLVGGTAYSIKNGKTLVGGTVYEVGFAPDTVTITITGSSGEYYVSVGIDGTTYWSATTIEVPVGTVVECWVNSDDRYYLKASVSVNGEEVASSLEQDVPITYLYTVTCNTTINLNDDYRSNSMAKGYSGTITITEE